MSRGLGQFGCLSDAKSIASLRDAGALRGADPVPARRDWATKRAAPPGRNTGETPVPHQALRAHRTSVPHLSLGAHKTPVRHRARRSPAYVLLEVVIATGMLVVALAIIGAQVQDSGTAIRKMERRLAAVRLAEQQFAYLDMGLVELDSVDEVQEGDFGPRYPDWGWRLTTEPTSVDGMFRLKLEVLHHIREGDYREDDFPWDDAEVMFQAYALRAAPRPLNMEDDFGLNEDELEDLRTKMEEAGIPFDPQNFDPSIFLGMDFEQHLESLPVILEALGLELGDLEAIIPPEILEKLKEEGLLEGGEDPEGGE